MGSGVTDMACCAQILGLALCGRRIGGLLAEILSCILRFAWGPKFAPSQSPVLYPPPQRYGSKV